ncbi:hypothetical protein [Streptomyces poriticola]|uniref:hypothetical protein n=1 Tax=Streptomyces poriticola TaxID=3120506 RepID=UPI002FCDF739
MAVDVRGHWAAHQTNGADVYFNLDQSGERISGDAFHNSNRGDCDGVVSGDDVVITVTWSSESRGRYTGHLGLDKRLSGYTVDLNHPTSQANWFSDPLPLMI